jgi:hypothetical protein
MEKFWMWLLLAALPAVDVVAWVTLAPGGMAPETARLVAAAGSVACFYWLLTGIYSFDEGSDLKLRTSLWARVAIGTASGLLLSALWRWPVASTALVGLAGGALGRYGLAWARFAHF